jgi:hypothetical protein
MTRPLSKHPVGFLIAFALGSFGGPVGLVVSPLLLFILGQSMGNMPDGTRGNAFLIWALAGIPLAPLCLAASVALVSAAPAPAPSPAPLTRVA